MRTSNTVPFSVIMGEMFILSLNATEVVLSGLVVIVLAIGPWVRGFKHGRNNRLLRTIKVRSASSFGGEIKPSTLCKILWHVKDPCGV
jgi:hypothetical protein